MLPVAHLEITGEGLFRIKTIVLPKESVEYNIIVNEDKYMVFRIRLVGTEDFSKAVSVNLLKGHKRYTRYYFFKSTNDICGWSRLEPGNYKLRIENTIGKEIPIYGYIVLFKNYDPRLPQLINEKIYGITNVPVPVGIADYGVYINKENNQLVCYRYSTKEVIGVAYLNELDGYSINPYNKDKKPGELSLQLNLVVETNVLDNRKHILWIQNIYVLKKSDNTLYYRINDEVHNITIFGKDIVDAKSIRGKGNVISYGLIKAYQYCDKDWRLITKPFKPVLLLLHVKVSGNKIYFAHGYFVDKNNRFYEVHDEVVLTKYKDLNIVVNGYEFIGTPLNMELVIGGRDSYYKLFVANSIDIKLTLLINNNVMWVPPPATWTVGKSTMEKALNVASILDYSVVVKLVRGEPKVKQLWSKDISSKISLLKPELYIVKLSNGTSSISVMPLVFLKEMRAEETYKVGSLSIVVLQEERTGIFTSCYYYVIAGLIIALFIIMLLRQKKKI